MLKVIMYTTLYVLSLTLLLFFDWQVAVGAFLLLTAHHFEKH